MPTAEGAKQAAGNGRLQEQALQARLPSQHGSALRQQRGSCVRHVAFGAAMEASACGEAWRGRRVSRRGENTRASTALQLRQERHGSLRHGRRGDAQQPSTFLASDAAPPRERDGDGAIWPSARTAEDT